MSKDLVHFFLLGLMSVTNANCQITSGDTKVKVTSELNASILSQKSLIPLNPKYKRTYFRILPYLFVDKSGLFNSIQGDFFNLKFNLNSDLNFMVGYWQNYGRYHNALIALIGESNTSTLPLKGVPVRVTSSKHGMFQQGELSGNHQINKAQQRVLFVLPLENGNNRELLQTIQNDTIRITVGGQGYKFISPEINR